MEINGKTVLVTGAAKRIGRAIALDLSSKGANIFIHYNGSSDEAAKLEKEVMDKGVKAWSGSADFKSEQETISLFKKASKAAGPIDILINNASIFPEDRFSEISELSLSENVKTNAFAPLLLAREFARRQGKGIVINMLDACMNEYTRDRLSYTLSKQMLHSITMSLALELAPDVRVNAVAPGLILPPEGEDYEYLAKRISTNPLNKHGDVEDVCSAIAYLINSPFVTGQVIYVDGGRHLKGFDCEDKSI